MFLQLDGTFWIQLVNFAIFFAILNVVFLRPVSRAIRARREHINSVLADLDRFVAEARELRERSESIRATARRDAEQTLAKARAEASNGAAELTTQYALQAQKTVEAAQQTVSSELSEARANEPEMVRGLAESMLARVLQVAS